jgi:molecular chaperone GrpE
VRLELTNSGNWQKLDPKYHYAVSHVNSDTSGENEIIEELQRGYIINDKVIRHSMVKVAN